MSRPDVPHRGWSNEATADFWDYLVSYRENDGLRAGLLRAHLGRDRETMKSLAARSLASHAGCPEGEAAASLALVDWANVGASLHVLSGGEPREVR